MEPEIWYIICSYLDGFDIKIMSFLNPEDRNIKLISDFVHDSEDLRKNKFLEKIMENRNNDFYSSYTFFRYKDCKNTILIPRQVTDTSTVIEVPFLERVNSEKLLKVKTIILGRSDPYVYGFLPNIDDLYIRGQGISVSDMYDIFKLKNLVTLSIRVDKKYTKLIFPKPFIDSKMTQLILNINSQKKTISIKNLPSGLKSLTIFLCDNIEKLNIQDSLKKLETIEFFVSARHFELNINKNNNVSVLSISKSCSIHITCPIYFKQTGLTKLSRVCTNWELTNFTDYKIPELLMLAAASSEAIEKNIVTFNPDYLITYDQIELTKK